MSDYTSPWQSAGNALSGMGNNFNQAILKIAQIKMLQEQRAQEMALRRQELEQQGAMYRSHMGLYDAQAAEMGARKAKEQAVVDSAKMFGQSARQSLASTMPPTDMSPTVDSARTLQGQQGQLGQEEMAAVISALNGNPQRFGQYQQSAMVNRALGPYLDPAVARAKFLGEKSMTVPHQGGVYDPTTQLITAVMPQVLAAGATQLPGTTGEEKFTSPNKPLVSQNDLGHWGNILRAVMTSGRPPREDSPSYSVFTNAIQRIIGMAQSPQGQPPAGAGAVSTHPQPKSQAEYDLLPSGTVYQDTDGSTKRKK